MSKQRTTEKSETKIPEWASRAGEANYAEASNWARQNPVQAYPGTLSALPDVNQYIAASMARNNAGADAIQPAKDLIARSATGQIDRVSTDRWSPANAAIYSNPYLQAVQQATLREMDRKAAMDQLDINQAAQNAKAFGGDRHGVMAAEAMRNNNMLRANYLDQSSGAAYEAARSGFLADQGRALQAAMANQSASSGDLDRMLRGSAGFLDAGRTGSDINTATIQNLGQTGGILQNLRQAGLDRMFDEYLRLQREPLERQRMLAGILSGTPMNSYFSGERVQNPGVLASVLGAMSAGAGALGSLGVKFSDRALKRGAVRIGEAIAGVGAYLFRYLWSDDWHVGVMADEVAVAAPDALGPRVAGFATVRYDRLPPMEDWQCFAA